MKIIVISNAATLQRLNDSLSAGDIVVVGLSAMSDLDVRLKQEKYDIVLVDSLLEDANGACASLEQLDVAPVGLLIHEDETNWKQLRSWNVDGFLPEEAGAVEMTARIKAILRRSHRFSKKREMHVQS